MAPNHSCIVAGGEPSRWLPLPITTGSEQKSEGRTVEPLTRSVAVRLGLTPFARARRGPVKLEGIPHGQVDSRACLREVVSVFTSDRRLALLYRGCWRGREVPLRGLAARSRLATSVVRLHRASAGSSSRLASSAGIARRTRLKSR